MPRRIRLRRATRSLSECCGRRLPGTCILRLSTSATAWMDVGAAAMTAVPAAPSAIEPDLVTKPAASGDDTSGPGKLQADEEKRTKEN